MKEYIEPVMPGARSSPTRERTLKRIVLLGIASGLCVLFLGLWYDLIANPKRVHRHNHSQIDIDIDDQEDALAPCPFGGKTLAPANYTVVRGLFRQDEPDFDGNGYDLLKDGFGLLDKSPDRWPNFTKYIADLNSHADEYTAYKVLYVARHGQGYHNVAESQYGTPMWNCHWSLLNGDGKITWGPDPLLTSLGEEQAAAANAGWKLQLRDDVPLPQRLYSSPLQRAAATLRITWGDIRLDKGARPVIKEMLRESIGLHTCDKRNSKSRIRETFPGFDFEPSFTEHDPLWDAEFQETEPQETVRLRLLLNEIFATDPSTFISITAHGGVIGALFNAIGKRTFPVLTGGFVPIVVKATSHPTATFSPVIRGQSATAPACPEGWEGWAPARATSAPAAPAAPGLSSGL